jgi:hypothetical protein
MKNNLRKNLDVFALFLPETKEFIKTRILTGLRLRLKI